MAEQPAPAAPEASPADDAELSAALAAASSPYAGDGLDALLDGVNAAPPGPERRGWPSLVAAAPDARLAELLERRRASREAARPPAAPAGADGLGALRGLLAERGLHGFLLPRTDAHRSEYLPSSAERVAWLTGFTGSAGTAAVLAEAAAVFVDGRYTEQAAREIDAGLFEVVPVERTPPVDWLAGRLKPGERLGYDPELHSPAEVARLEAALAKAGASAVALDANPVDALWRDRPPAPLAPIRRLDARYAGEEEEAKRKRMGEAVAKAGADTAVLAACDSIAWLLNLRGGDIPYNPLFLAYALLRSDGALELFVDPRKKPPALALPAGVTLRPYEAFGAALDALGRPSPDAPEASESDAGPADEPAGRCVLIDPAATNALIVGRLRAAGARVVEGADPCLAAKARKSPAELAGARAAHLRDGAALCRFLAWLDTEAMPGEIDEVGLAARIDAERAKDPLYRGPSFPTISGSGPNGAVVHYRATPETARPLDDDTLYLVDSGGQYPDATTDVTRTVAIGTPTPRMKEAFTAVLRGHIALARAVFPRGTRGGQLDALARRFLWRLGLDYEHGTGHGVGSYLCVHEGPARFAKRAADAALEPGMILSNEPGYYKPGAFGIRTENLVAVVEAPRARAAELAMLAFETLTRAPIDRRLIEPRQMDDDEIAWLDRYHARVKAGLMPLVGRDPDVASWLAAATAPMRESLM